MAVTKEPPNISLAHAWAFTLQTMVATWCHGHVTCSCGGFQSAKWAVNSYDCDAMFWLRWEVCGGIFLIGFSLVAICCLNPGKPCCEALNVIASLEGLWMDSRKDTARRLMRPRMHALWPCPRIPPMPPLVFPCFPLWLPYITITIEHVPSNGVFPQIESAIPLFVLLSDSISLFLFVA